MMDSVDRTSGDRRQVLEALDSALAARDEAVQPAALALTTAVVTLRDGLIAALRSGDTSRRSELDHVNSLLSLVVSVQYPMQGQSRDKLDDARRQYLKLLDDLGSEPRHFPSQ